MWHLANSSVNLLTIGGKLASLLVTLFNLVTKLISQYSTGFLFLSTRNQVFLYSPSKYSNTSLFSLSYSILITIGYSALRQGKFSSCQALCSIIFSIIRGDTSLWNCPHSVQLNVITFSLLIIISLNSSCLASCSMSLTLRSFICLGVS